MGFSSPLILKLRFIVIWKEVSGITVHDTCKQQPIKVTTTTPELLIKIGEASKNEWLLNLSCFCLFCLVLFFFLLGIINKEKCSFSILGVVFYIQFDEMSTQTQPLFFY